MAAVLVLAAGGVARAQQSPVGAASNPPPSNADAPPGPAPEPAELAPPPEATPTPNPTVAPTVPPAPVKARPAPPQKPKWLGPVTITLEVGAVGFAVASVAVISSGPTTDAWRVNTAAGLGAGTIACAAVGVVLGIALR